LRIELEVNLDPQEGLPDCIANEDGERQIATAIAFHGEEMVSSKKEKRGARGLRKTIVGSSSTSVIKPSHN